MSGNNRWSVADAPVEFEDNQLKGSGELPIILKESVKYTSNEWKHQNQKMSVWHVTGSMIGENRQSVPDEPVEFEK